jgi:hypothetical protein
LARAARKGALEVIAARRTPRRRFGFAPDVADEHVEIARGVQLAGQPVELFVQRPGGFVLGQGLEDLQQRPQAAGGDTGLVDAVGLRPIAQSLQGRAEMGQARLP